MSIGRADARFLLPRLPRTAVVLGGLDGWRDALRQAGIDCGEVRRGAPDVAVAPASLATEALATGASMVVLEGRDGRRRVRAAGLDAAAALPLPALEEPELVLPIAQRAPAAYALTRWRPAAEPHKRLRNHLVARLLGAGVAPPGRAVVTLGARPVRRPALLERATALGIEPGEWLVTFPGGPSLARGAFHVFQPSSHEPAWLVKFARAAGDDAPFVRDERGLALAAAAPVAAARAPRLLGRFELDGHHAAVETAAAGTTLQRLLVGPAGREQKLQLCAAVVRWLLEVARETASPAAMLEPERRRLAQLELPGAPFDASLHRLPETLPAIPGVLQHNDLWEENVVFRGDDFAVIDWEWGAPCGLPLWDLVRFGALALGLVDGARSQAERDRHFVDLHRGNAASSPVYFGWLREAAAASSVPPDAVGPIVTLHWVDHALRALPAWRTESLPTATGGGPLTLSRRLAELWLTEPGLGPSWAAWRG